MKTCPVCRMVLANQAIRCPGCKHVFSSSDADGIIPASGKLGKLNNPPQKVRISSEGELCWVPLNGRDENTRLTGVYNNAVGLHEKQLTNQQPSPSTLLARERAEAAKAQIAARRAAEARQEKN